jgi:hypothetical protein
MPRETISDRDPDCIVARAEGECLVTSETKDEGIAAGPQSSIRLSFQDSVSFPTVLGMAEGGSRPAGPDAGDGGTVGVVFSSF